MKYEALMAFLFQSPVVWYTTSYIYHSELNYTRMSCWLCQIVCLTLYSRSCFFSFLYFLLPDREYNACHFQSPFRSTTGSGWGQGSVVSRDRHCRQRGTRLIDESRPAGLCTKFFGPGGTAQQEASSCRLLLSELQGWRGKVQTH